MIVCEQGASESAAETPAAAAPEADKQVVEHKESPFSETIFQDEAMAQPSGSS